MPNRSNRSRSLMVVVVLPEAEGPATMITRGAGSRRTIVSTAAVIWPA